MECKDKKVLVVGTGISGIAAAKLLLNKGAIVTLYDEKTTVNQEQIQDQLQADTKVSVICGTLSLTVINETDLLVLSPGVPVDQPWIVKMKENGIPVWGEIELAFLFDRGTTVAITGTNGKTTTTALTGEIMKTIYPEVFVVGNIGVPYTEMVTQTTETSVTVAEISSFQLETIQEFHPHVSAILNITPDHLNRHHTMENYIAVKAEIAKNQSKDDICILNYEDEALRKIGENLSCQVIWFSGKRRLIKGLFLENNHIIYCSEGTDTIIIDVGEMNIIGVHNYENAMAAIACGLSMKVPLSSIQKALMNFRAVEHRIEFVAEKNGVKYYNDSKGTNPDASIQAVRAMPAKTVLIGGGYDKGSEYDEWIESFNGKVSYLVLMGQTREKIAECARRHGFDSIVFVESMEEAVEFGKAHTEPGDCVLLSPCCASWGMFKNYEERGRIFKELVHQIQ